MIFNSVEFLIFFPIVFFIYFLVPHRIRWFILLISSYYFYMAWRPEYVLLILLSTIIDYFASLRMGQLPDKKPRRKYLYLSLIANLGLLFTFKYFNFFSDSFQSITQFFGTPIDSPALNILLPVGISFYTFQTLSYTIDVYQGKLKPEKHFGIFALYVSFWPQLVAGPIERASRLLPQFHEHVSFDYQRAREGFIRILFGFFKKLVVADRLAIFVNEVYNAPDAHSGMAIIVATVFFAFQIYCDFSGYSDIAIGTAKVLGFDLMENFRTPYLAHSITDFWRKWHISLSTWFRDYVYIPLGGNRVRVGRWVFNILVTFLVSGLWHGANWTFVIWGGLHGLYLLFERLFNYVGKRIGIKELPLAGRIVTTALTFVLVTFAWLFFRANSLSDAMLLLQQITAENGQPLTEIVGGVDYYLSLGVLGVLIAHELLLRGRSIDTLILKQTAVVRWGYYLSILMFISLFGVFTSNAFIYFQF